ncbi:MAG: rod-binding protein [Geminicoccaceae bacterium]|nr:rod-binding protein [Geminicoccaceae bacterium]MCB9945097.1 rod-binding protein [Geminicoccaceae bacterium]
MSNIDFHGNVGAPASDAAGSVPTARMRATADEFESVFLSQVLRGLSTGLEDSGPLADSDSNPFADMLQQEYAKLISRSGGIGIADAVLKEMLKMQEQPE